MEENNSNKSHSVPQMIVKYKDNSFECEIISDDAKFITETLDNIFNAQGTAKELSDILAGIEVPPVVQQKLDIVFAKVKVNTEKTAEAVKENS